MGALKASRFLLPSTRQLPYRDADGLVSLPLLRFSVEEVRKGAVAPPEPVADKLRKWLSHAEKAFARAGESAAPAAAGASAAGVGTGKRTAAEAVAGADEATATAEKKRRREVADEACVA